MKNFETNCYALQDADGNLIALDRESGGYPWIPDSMNGVWLSTDPFWHKQYQKHNPQFKLVRVKITVEEV